MFPLNKHVITKTIPTFCSVCITESFKIIGVRGIVTVRTGHMLPGAEGVVLRLRRMYDTNSKFKIRTNKSHREVYKPDEVSK